MSITANVFLTSSQLNKHPETLFRTTIRVFSYWVAGCTVLDITVAAILITCLLKSKTGLDASDTVLNRVILTTLETALLPSISMLVAVIVLHGAPNPGHHDDIVMFFLFITAKLYTIGLLRTLNARTRLRERIDSTDMGRTSLAKWTWDQDHRQQDQTSDQPDRASQELEAASATLRGPVDAVSPCENAHGEVRQVGTQHVHFGSPLLDQRERGSYTRLRVSSIHKAGTQPGGHL
ncbi:hypothetical protein GGX14DRAFT_413020 [Mycena pura]|uniref:DUF6534 domain-containing protein n=1 Tax=Mycena pura TaxID=153505 RepID=A0AAD7E564_9AGAR|nr:hypothetical protein GGX14DRAFT_413020 [Mycena pura]